MGYGQNLKNILDEKGMTVKELAKKVGIAPTQSVDKVLFEKDKLLALVLSLH